MNWAGSRFSTDCSKTRDLDGKFICNKENHPSSYKDCVVAKEPQRRKKTGRKHPKQRQSKQKIRKVQKLEKSIKSQIDSQTKEHLPYINVAKSVIKNETLLKLLKMQPKLPTKVM
jgi:hypothetical protein